MGKTILRLCAEVIIVLGAFACTLQWLGIKPTDFHMTVSVPHVVWLIVGLALFGISLWSSLRTCIWQAKRLAESDKRHWEAISRADITNAAERLRDTEAHREEIEKLEAEKRAALDEISDLKSKLGFLSPLQQDALFLSTRLLDFIEAQGQPPQPKYTRAEIDRMSSAETERLLRAHDRDFDFACEFHFGGGNFFDGPRTADELSKLMTARFMLLDPWYEKVRASYDLQFRDEVEQMRNRFSVEGLPDDVLRVPVQGKMGRENIKAIASKLWELSYKLRDREISLEEA
jgi:hypothetical protein